MNPMNEDRPDPDALLVRVQAEEARQKRGKLKIFFGYAPGVGKTYAMLEAARKIAKEGADVVIGYVEPHVRPETQALTLGLDVLARKEIHYRERTFQEFDLEAALERRPRLIVVDELAHANVAAPTEQMLVYTKRWQDVERLLEAGIDVYTTLNVQHLESLNDLVAKITGVTVRERVPDSVFDKADEIELVDLAPEELIERLHEGRVYVPQQAKHAVENFFQTGNLIALRELALRRTAERVGSQMEDYRQLQASTKTWPAADRLMVCVGPSPHAQKLVRAARRMAASLHAPWLAVHIEVATPRRLSNEDRDRLAQTLHLAEQLGGEAVTLSAASFADDVLHYARSRNVTKILIGKPQQPRWREWLRGAYVYELARRCGDIDLYLISGEESEDVRAAPQLAATPIAWAPYAWSAFVVALCTAAGFLIFPYLDLDPLNLVMVFLLGVVGVSLRLGRGPSIVASILSVGAFDFFFVPPYYTLHVADPRYLLTFGVMLLTGLVISTLVSRVRAQADFARLREQRTTGLYALSRDLVNATTATELAECVPRHIHGLFDAEVFVLLPPRATANGTARLVDYTPAKHPLTDNERGVADWVFEHGKLAGQGTDTLPASTSVFVPLRTKSKRLGVLGFRPREPIHRLSPDQRRLVEAFAGQIALAAERIRAADDAQQARLQIEAERLRSSLLSAVSHDLRTPLSAITGASSTLLDAGAPIDEATRRELAQSILNESARLNRLVANLLDMTRLDAGVLAVQREWQPLEEVVGVVLARLAPQLVDRPIHTHIAADLPLVPIDDLLIQQVLTNLLENAVKYSPARSPIDLRATFDADNVTVEVADRGPGLAPDELDRIFTRFYRSKHAGTASGVGLGLAICKGVVELHGGRIWAENRAQGGASIHFTLPRLGEPPTMIRESTHAQ